MGHSRGQSQGHRNPQGRLHPPLPEPTKSYLISTYHKWLCASSQAQPPEGNSTCPYAETSHRNIQKSNILGFLQQTFIGPKPNKWRPILDLSSVNKFLNSEKFKMETPESIRTSLQTGEWVTSIKFKNAYFHIPINPQSRKYLRFHVQGQSYQFKALPIGLSTAPVEFTRAVNEVKLMDYKYLGWTEPHPTKPV